MEILAIGKYHLAGSRFPAANACTIEPSDDRLYPTNFPAGRYPLECLSLPLMFLTLFTGCHWVVLHEPEGDMNRRVIAKSNILRKLHETHARSDGVSLSSSQFSRQCSRLVMIACHFIRCASFSSALLIHFLPSVFDLCTNFGTLNAFNVFVLQTVHIYTLTEYPKNVFLGFAIPHFNAKAS